MAKGSELDMRRLQALAQRVLRTLGTSTVKVGVLSSKGGDADRDGISMVELAAIHEFGSPAANIPERSFIRRTFAAKEREVAAMSSKIGAAIFAGRMDARRGLEILGAWGATEVKKTITSGAGIPPPNAPSTIAKKGSDRPLVDTGRLLGAITWEVK